MGWDNDHLHAFFFKAKEGRGVSYWYNSFEIGSPFLEDDQHPTLHTNEILVASIDYTKHQKMGFVFDFGDNHRFFMEYKNVRGVNEDEDIVDFPKVIDQRGVPPVQYQ